MNVVIAATSRFHYFDLAQQLARLGALGRMYTGYPRWKLPSSKISPQSICTVPWIHTFFMALQRTYPRPTVLSESLDWLDRVTFDAYVAKNLPECDVLTAISGCGLRSGMKAKATGGKYVCDRGSTHILYQNSILKEESSEWGLPFTPTHPRIIERELLEYEEADLITVPSAYAKRTFITAGLDEQKLAVIPYGVDLSSFYPTDTPRADSFVVAYVGGINFRKGIHYLFQAFNKIKHPKKSLLMIGQEDTELTNILRAKRIHPREVTYTGHIGHTVLKHYLSRADVLALPSVEDGFGLVMAQAMACGCPVVASEHTGGPEIVRNGFNGYVVPARDVSALAHALQSIAESSPDRRMREGALATAREMRGWSMYGEQIFDTYRALAGSR